MPYGPPLNNTNTGMHSLTRCLECAALVPNNAGEKLSHENYHQQVREQNVSQVKWCDNGEHAFKANEPGSQSFQGTEYDENGTAQQVQRDVCAKHSFQSQAKALKAAQADTEDVA